MPPRGSDTVDVNACGDATLKTMAEHKDEVVRIAVRLAELFPVGSSVMFAIDLGQPRIVDLGGKPIGGSAEIVLITRPAAYVGQQAKLERRTP